MFLGVSKDYSVYFNPFRRFISSRCHLLCIVQMKFNICYLELLLVYVDLSPPKL